MRIACLLVALTVVATAQTPSPVASALNRLAAAETSKTRFTDHKLTRTTNIAPDGTDLYSATELYEETWINNLPYQRLIALDGKPLTGLRAREEQSRYDAAVAGRRPLGTTQRIELNKVQAATIDANPEQALSPAYTLRELRSEAATTVFTASPRGPASTCNWRYTLWISPGHFLSRYRADATSSTPACDGAWQDVSYTLVDGIPKPSHTHSHFFQPEGPAGHQERITIDGDDTFTDYRRFTTTVTIGPATVTAPQKQQ